MLFFFQYYIFGCVGFSLLHGTFSSCGDWGLLSVAVCGLLIVVASLVVEHRLQVRGLQQLWLTGSRAPAQQLWCTGLVAPWHVGSSWTRARTHVPCIGRQILNHCTTREAREGCFLFCLLYHRFHILQELQLVNNENALEFFIVTLIVTQLAPGQCGSILCKIRAYSLIYKIINFK